LSEIPGLALRQQQLPETCPFFYVVRVLDGRRDVLMDDLKQADVTTGVHYLPNHLHQAFAHQRTSLPTAERLAGEILTLPLFYEMTDEQVEFVIAAVHRFCTAAPRLVVVPLRDDAAGARRQPARTISPST